MENRSRTRSSARMFHTLVVVGASLGTACGPQVATEDDGGDDGSSEAGASTSTSGPGTSVGTSAGTNGTTETGTGTSVTASGPGTVTTVGEVSSDDGSDGTCPPDGCKLDIGGGTKLDLPADAGPYDCCWSNRCSPELVCDPNWYLCTAYCMDPGFDCPPPPAGTAQPACVDTGGPPVCMLDCTAGEECPPGFECVQWSGIQSVCSPQCVIPIG